MIAITILKITGVAFGLCLIALFLAMGYEMLKWEE